MTRQEKNKRIVRAYVRAFNRGDFDALRRLFSDRAVIQGVLGKGGLDVVMPIWRELHQGLGIALAVEEMVAAGDVVAVRYRERGRFHGPLRGQAPTGKPYELVAMEWFVIEKDRIVKRWGARDHASLARQIGLELA